METKRKLKLNIRKRLLKFLGHVIKEGLGNLIHTGQRKAAHNIFDGLEQMDGRMGFGKNNKKTTYLELQEIRKSGWP